MIFSIPNDLPILYDKNRRTFIFILSFLIGLLYLAIITSNGLKGFTNTWQKNPDHEHYILVPYSGNTEELIIDTKKIEEFLKNSSSIKGFRKIDEQAFQRLFNPPSPSKSWIETIPFPVFIELNLKKSAKDRVDHLEEEIKKIVPNAQFYTQPRYSTEFIQSFRVLNVVLDCVICCLIMASLAVLVLMTRAHFSQQEKNIERLSLLGATPSYIKKLYCWFMAKCIALSSLYGFLGGFILCWGIYLGAQNIAFFPYGFAPPSLLLYLSLPYSCIVLGVGITYLLITRLLKKLCLCK